MSEKDKNQSRRQFLDKGVIVGTGLALGLGAVLKSDKQSETIKMITLDGQLVEVDPKYINKMCSGRVSNATLKKWMDEEQNKSTT